MTTAVESKINELRNALRRGRLITDPDLMEAYRRDQTAAVPAGVPIAVVIAATTDDVVATLRWASTHRVPVVPRGAGTSLAGGATAISGCIVLSLEAMDRVIEVSSAEKLAVAQAGVITANLDRAARQYGLMYAPDPSSYEVSTIGGNLATNAGGLRCLKYGVTRDAALGLEVVLSDGRVIRTGHRTLKGVVGYDLTGLFVGSEGTLGVITSAILRLRPLPPVPPVTVAAAFGSLTAAAGAVEAIVSAGIDTALLELMDRTTLLAIDDWKHTDLSLDTDAMLIVQCDGPTLVAESSRVARCCEETGASMVAVSSDDVEAAQLLQLRRFAYPATERLGTCLVEDVCVPVPALATMIGYIQEIAAARDVRIATVAHAGDGNLHPTFVYDRRFTETPVEVWAAAEDVFRAALELGGTLTGEHGIGSLKVRWVRDELGADTHAAHQAIKASLDPMGILNPGRAI